MTPEALVSLFNDTILSSLASHVTRMGDYIFDPSEDVEDDGEMLAPEETACVIPTVCYIMKAVLVVLKASKTLMVVEGCVPCLMD